MKKRPLWAVPLDPGMDPFLADPMNRTEYAALLRQHVVRFYYFLEMQARGKVRESKAMIPHIGDDSSKQLLCATLSGNAELVRQIMATRDDMVDVRAMRVTEQSIQKLRMRIADLIATIEEDLQVEPSPERVAARAAHSDEAFQRFLIGTLDRPARKRRGRGAGNRPARRSP